jgi:hypothetical protein
MADGMELLHLYWSMYNKKFKTLVECVSFSQLRAFVVTVSKDEYEHWMVWREDQAQWNELEEMISQILPVNSRDHTPPSLPPHVVGDGLPENMIQGLVAEALTPQLTPPPANDNYHTPRLALRLHRSFDLMIDYKGRLITTKTVDISLSGMKIQQNLGTEIYAPFNVVLKSTYGNVDLICELLTSDNPSDRARLKILSTRSLEKLREILMKSSQADKG